MRGPKDAPIILYPTYFDVKCSRADGRKVSKNLAVADPAVDDIAKAVAACGWRALIDRKHHYPKELQITMFVQEFLVHLV